EGIDERLGRPRFDPHGDAIPDAAGHVAREPFVLLAQAAIGHEGRVLRVSDTDPDLLCALEELGLSVSSAVRVTDGGVEIDGAVAELPDGAVDVVWLSA